MNDFYTMLADGLAQSSPKYMPAGCSQSMVAGYFIQWNKDVSRTATACAMQAATTGAEFNTLEFYDACGYEYKRS